MYPRVQLDTARVADNCQPLCSRSPPHLFSTKGPTRSHRVPLLQLQATERRLVRLERIHQHPPGAGAHRHALLRCVPRHRRRRAARPLLALKTTTRQLGQLHARTL